jgi:hypothetical protein
MKESIPSLIAYCNQSILSWYRKEMASDIHEFTPVDKDDKELIENIYQMYITFKGETNTKKHMLLSIVKYYFAIAVVEYYVLLYMDYFFNTDIMTKNMLEFSTNPSLSQFRKKMLGFNYIEYQVKPIKLHLKL